MLSARAHGSITFFQCAGMKRKRMWRNSLNSDNSLQQHQCEDRRKHRWVCKFCFSIKIEYGWYWILLCYVFLSWNHLNEANSLIHSQVLFSLEVNLCSIFLLIPLENLLCAEIELAHMSSELIFVLSKFEFITFFFAFFVFQDSWS